MTVVDRLSSRRDEDEVPAALVRRVHAAVGEALTQRHATDEAAGRQRLAPDDERALSRKLIADELGRLTG